MRVPSLSFRLPNRRSRSATSGSGGSAERRLDTRRCSSRPAVASMRDPKGSGIGGGACASGPGSSYRSGNRCGASGCCGAEGRLQICLGNAWQDMGAEEDRSLRRAHAAGQTRVRFEARGQVYECDFELMQQVNLLTGKTRTIRFCPRTTRLQHPQLLTALELPLADFTLAPAPAAALLHDRGSGAADTGAGLQAFLLDDDTTLEAALTTSRAASRATSAGFSSGTTSRTASVGAASAVAADLTSVRTATPRTTMTAVPGVVEVKVDACWVYPRWLHIRVPQGPVFAAGAYELVDGRAHNSFPVWRKAVGEAGTVECWLYSTLQQHWVVGGVRGQEGLDHGFAWLYSQTRHQGLAPDKVLRTWQHNQPEWTSDRGIVVTEVLQDSELPSVASECAVALVVPLRPAATGLVRQESPCSPGSQLQLPPQLPQLPSQPQPQTQLPGPRAAGLVSGGGCGRVAASAGPSGAATSAAACGQVPAVHVPRVGDSKRPLLDSGVAGEPWGADPAGQVCSVF